MIRGILQDYKIHHAAVLIREVDVTVEEFIDVLLGTRKYLPALYIYNSMFPSSLRLIDD